MKAWYLFQVHPKYLENTTAFSFTTTLCFGFVDRYNKCIEISYFNGTQTHPNSMNEFVCKPVLNFNESFKFEKKFQIWKSFVYKKKFLKIREKFKSERKFHRWEFQIWKKFLIWMKVSYIKKVSKMKVSIFKDSYMKKVTNMKESIMYMKVSKLNRFHILKKVSSLVTSRRVQASGCFVREL